MPLVSVIIPVYNRAGFVEEALASVRSQDYRDREILVVDDGSTDDTAARCRAFGDEVRYIFQPHAGPAAARNRGVAAATGRWIAFLDSDDSWTAGGLRDRMNALDGAGSEVGVVYADAIVIGPGRDAAERKVSDRRVPRAGDVSEALFRENFICTSTVVLRRDLFLAAGGFRSEYEPAEDLDLWLRIARRTMFAYVARPVARYRVHPGALGADRARAIGAEIRALEDHAAGPALRLPSGWRARLARLHYFRGLLTLEERRGDARRCFGRSLRYRPLFPRAWACWLASCAPGVGTRRTRRFLDALDLY